jgi:hypothetical protein
MTETKPAVSVGGGQPGTRTLKRTKVRSGRAPGANYTHPLHHDRLIGLEGEGHGPDGGGGGRGARAQKNRPGRVDSFVLTHSVATPSPGERPGRE